MGPGSKSRSARIGLPLLSAAASLAVYAFITRDGIEIWPDGWAYWQGATSILEGKGYRYFSGNPIMAWPPLYSLYLTGWTALSGQTAAGLIFSNALLVAIQACAWTWLAGRIGTAAGRPEGFVPGLAVALYVALFVAFNERNVFAQNLLYAILPLQVFFVWRATTRREGNPWIDVLGVAITAEAMMAVHYSSIAFTAAACILILAAARAPFRTRVLGCALVAGAAMATFALLRTLLGQSGSHKIGPGTGLVSTTQNLVDAAAGLRTLLFPSALPVAALAVFLAALCVVSARSGTRATLRAAAYVLVSAVLLALLFSNTLILNTLDGRFIFFMPLVLIPVAMHEAFAVRPAWGWVVVLAVLPVLGARIVQNRATLPPTVQEAMERSGSIPSAVLLPWAAQISREPAPASAIVRDGRILVGPYPWEEPLRGKP